ncbi:MAG: hypothetical protein JRN15_10430 [Nitrososphaerota archaeon]|nr:hypothetical protein [Nitrososphaerota archaeon]
MGDDTSTDSFREELTLRGLNFEERKVGNSTAFIIGVYPIIYGRNSGKSLTLGFVLPLDYPSTAPAGVHYRWTPDLGNAPGNPQSSDLGGGWQRMSRVVQGWVPGHRTSSHYLAQVDGWLELV